MQILWLKSDLLLPLDKGGKLRTWHLMRHLAKRHEITYLGFADAHEPEPLRAAHLEGMREVAAHVEAIPFLAAPKRSRRFYLEAAAHLIDPLPYAVGKYRSRAYRARVREFLDERPFDLIVCDFLPPAVNLPRKCPCPVVLFTHNVEAEIWRRYVSTRSNLPAKLLYGTQHRRMLRYEGRALERFDGVLAVSDADAETFRRLYPGRLKQPIRVVPTGVDTSFFTPIPDRTPGRRLVFTGSMDWLPNEDAMRYFCRDILPLVRADEPDTTLAIVGRAPTPQVLELRQIPGVTVTGRVDDVRPRVGEADVYIVPLRIGGGTRLKIFEAMAMGKAIVSTTIGAEGLPVSDARQLLIADEPRSFSHQIVRLLRNPERRRSLEQAARAFVVAHHDWSSVAGHLEEALQDVALSGKSLEVPSRAIEASDDRRWGWGPIANR